MDLPAIMHVFVDFVRLLIYSGKRQRAEAMQEQNKRTAAAHDPHSQITQLLFAHAH